MARFAGKVVVVTGGGGGIGGATCRRFASEGAKVAVFDLNLNAASKVAAGIEQAEGRIARRPSLSLSSSAIHHRTAPDVDAAVGAAEAENSLGPIDVLVNNAGWDMFRPFVKTEPAQWDKLIAINLIGALHMHHAVLPGMISRKRGRIVNIASDAARVGSVGEAVYAACKGGIVAFSKTIAREHARHGITVNVVCPGPTDTALFAEYKEGAGNPEKLMEAFTRSIPLGRIGQPDDLPGAILFFASDDAGYITGQVLSVSGGLTMNAEADRPFDINRLKPLNPTHLKVTIKAEFQDMIYEIRNGAAWITINRPEKMNSFRGQTCDEIIKALNKAGYDKSVGAIVLAGAGEKAFCTGGDQSAHNGNYDGRGTIGLPMEELHTAIRDVPKPVIARVQGFAIGGGNVLCTICDLTICSEKAIFGQVGPKMGSVDPGYGTAFLARVVGEKKAREIWYLNKRYSGQEAVAMGLANICVPPEKLDETVQEWAETICERSPTAIAIAKRSFNADTAHQSGIAGMGMYALKLYYDTEESREGVNALKDKRKPEFRKYAK